MPRPKKIEEGEMQDVPQVAMAPVAQPLRPSIERQGPSVVPMSIRFPRVIGGICEACGVIDRHQKSTEQYKLCPHYAHIGQLRCSYCSELVNPDDVAYHQPLNIATHPNDAMKLVVWCQQYDCLKKHEERFRNRM